MATVLFEGVRGYSNSAAPIASAYMRRRALVEMGYTVNLHDDSEFLVECFLILDAELKHLAHVKAERERAHGRQ